MYTLLLICSLISLYHGDALQFKSTDDSYERRTVASGTPLVSNKLSVAWWRSVQINNKDDVRVQNNEADWIWGSVYVGDKIFPVYWLSYFDVFDAIANSTQDFTNFNVSASRGFIISSFLKIMEMKPNNVTVATVTLDTVRWAYSYTASAALSNSSQGIYAYVFIGTSKLFTSIQLQYIVSEVGGTLDLFDGVMVVPKAVESIIVINGWKYSNISNYLLLQIAVGTTSSYWSIDGQIQSSKKGNDTFFRLVDKAYVDGVVEKANISEATKSVNISNAFPSQVFANVIKQLNSVYGNNAEAWLLNVQFPAGKSNITYDPTMGVGSSPFTPTTSAPIVVDDENNGLLIGLSVGGTIFVIVVVALVTIIYKTQKREYVKIVE